MAGCGCLPGFPMSNSINFDHYILDHSPTVEWGARWAQPNFPNTPCTDPHNIRWQFRMVYPSVGSWAVVGTDPGTDCAGTKTKDINIGNGGASTQLANASTWYYRDFFACTEGVYELRIRHLCGAGHWSVAPTRIVRVRRMHSNL